MHCSFHFTPQNRYARHVGDNDFRFCLLFPNEWILRMTKNRKIFLRDMACDTACDTAGHMERKRSRERDECNARTKIVRHSHCSRTNVFVYMNGILLFWLRCNRHSHARHCTQMLASDEWIRFVLCNNDSVCWSEPAYRHQHFTITLTAALARHWFSQLTFEVPTVDNVSILTFKYDTRLERDKSTESYNQIKLSDLSLECAALTRSQMSQLIKHMLSHNHINGVDWPDLACCFEQYDTCILPSYDPKARYRMFGSVCLCIFGEYSATDIRKLDLIMRASTCGFPLSASCIQICLFWFLLLCEKRTQIYFSRLAN